MQKQAVVGAHRAGLFSLLNNVMTCMQIYGAENVSVDWTGSIYSPESNLWDELFAPRPAPEGSVDLITEYPNQRLTYKHAAELYQGNPSWRAELNKLWNQIRIKDEIRREAWELACWLFDRVDRFNHISILIRGNEHAGEQITNKAQTFDEYARALDLELRDNPEAKIYVASQDMESLHWFDGRFPIIYHPGTKRSQSRDVQRHLAEPQGIDDARQVLSEALILSMGRAFIHPVSNISTAVLYINPRIKSIFLP